MTAPFEQLVTPHGTVVLLELADADIGAALDQLPAAERSHALALTAIRRRDFVAGRTALHAALTVLGVESVAILSDDRGAPRLPTAFTGSVSHKGALAAAIVAPLATGFVGVDVERAAPPRRDLATRILTAREQSTLPSETTARGRAVTLHFALKEAIYKAVDPVVRRYVGFTEVELAVEGNRCAVASALPLAVEAAYVEHAAHWLATARAVRR